MTNQRGKGRAVAALAALCALAALSGQGAQAATGPQRPYRADSPYRYDPHARPVTAAATGQGAPRLAAGKVYRSAVGPGTKAYFQVDLGSTGDAYVSAVAVPKPDTEVAFGDGIELTLQDRDGNTCDTGRAVFGSPEYPRPIAAYVSRGLTRNQTSCQAAGPYYVLVQRIGGAASTPGEWGLELRHTREPRLTVDAATTAPTHWATTAPPVPSSAARAVHGGTGFADAAPLSGGAWRDTLKPGATLFYRVPVGWGQQLSATAELGRAGGSRYVDKAIDLQLYNPALGPVVDVYTGYDGRPASVAFQPLAPVAYENRYSTSGPVAALRFGGDHYLAVSLSPKVAQVLGPGAYSVTLRVGVRGEAKPAPAYEGAAPDFAADGRTTSPVPAAAPPGHDGGSTRMRLLAAGGIGTGTLLVGWLGVRTLVARRRAQPVRPG
ncbi:hypothetical protein [Streptomyces sp. TLI_146]|uniref:hypothetical protein n=1 Tax=Streptomyces sp. TLI_146 TaxID=1938858 RepID=UPI000C710F3F|nr:hypothetical protein [Streptomyces sp. TLI_146]PKV86727.1 hypothetical protein BX283_4297 [Streptomyces sp. TLI_146]